MDGRVMPFVFTPRKRTPSASSVHCSTLCIRNEVSRTKKFFPAKSERFIPF